MIEDDSQNAINNALSPILKAAPFRNNELQRRALISRDQMKSDQAMIENDGQKRQVIDQKAISHYILNEEEIIHDNLHSEIDLETGGQKQTSPTKSGETQDAGEDEVVLFFETKYCTVCHIEQVRIFLMIISL